MLPGYVNISLIAWPFLFLCVFLFQRQSFSLYCCIMKCFGIYRVSAELEGDGGRLLVIENKAEAMVVSKKTCKPI